VFSYTVLTPIRQAAYWRRLATEVRCIIPGGTVRLRHNLRRIKCLKNLRGELVSLCALHGKINDS
jgi:hypothetical protein